MESLLLNLESKNEIIGYMADNHFVAYECGIFNEMLTAIENRDQSQLDWFCGFGDSFRHITMNVYAYRKGLEFGFNDIGFDQYGWFKRPVFLDVEHLNFGDMSRYGNYSTIDLGRGLNGVWTYAQHYSFGVAGGGYALSVYGKPFGSREAAQSFALNELKEMMTAKIGSRDTLNDKQPVILATLRDIAKAQNALVQLSLF